MINIPIWLFVLLCVFGFIGVCAFVLLIYGIIITIVAPMQFDKKIKDAVESPYVLPWTRQACLDAYKRSGLTVDDIDAICGGAIQYAEDVRF